MSVLKAMRTVAQIAGYFVFLFGIVGALLLFSSPSSTSFFSFIPFFQVYII